MNIVDLKQSLYTAQKQKDTLRVSVLRYLISAINNKEIELKAQGEVLTDAHIEKIARKQIKQRNEASEGYEKVGNAEMAQKEQDEKQVLEEVFPETLGE